MAYEALSLTVPTVPVLHQTDSFHQQANIYHGTTQFYYNHHHPDNNMPVYHSPEFVAAAGENYHPANFQWHYPQNYALQTKQKNFGPNGKPKRRRIATPTQRRAANIRERKRMCNLNESFDTLRTKVPTFAYEKRLSRIETLRLAITYISFLKDITEGKDPDQVKLVNLPKSSELARVKRAMANMAHDKDFSADIESDCSSELSDKYT